MSFYGDTLYAYFSRTSGYIRFKLPQSSVVVFSTGHKRNERGFVEYLAVKI
jgi:hypothetical protein